MYQKDKEYMAEVGHLIQHPKTSKIKGNSASYSLQSFGAFYSC